MSEQLPTCPNCGSTNIGPVTVHNPETSDLNAKATLKCAECRHTWEGQVTSPRTEDDRDNGWSL